MLKNKVMTLAALVFGAQLAFGQNGTVREIYQIISGRFSTCCGIAGPITQALPNSDQSYIKLAVNTNAGSAQLTILGQDSETVFLIPDMASRPHFTYQFTNGMVQGNVIQFGDPVIVPDPVEARFSYVVTNLAGTLIFNGSLSLPSPGCGDIPNEFSHSNVVAVLMPATSIHVSAVEVCWPSVSNRNYQVQFRSVMTTNIWTNLGMPVGGTGSSLCVTDQVSAEQPERYYRVTSLP